MKKVLVAAAGLMLVGAMASSAMAEVKFSGDARARYYYHDNYVFTNADDEAFENWDYDNWASRVRLNVVADTKGGAYVVSRLHIGDGGWGKQNNATTDVDATSEVTVDRAYVGVPFGPITVEAGRQNRDTTTFLYYGDDVDGIDFNYKTDKTTLVAFYDVAVEVLNNETNSDDDNIWNAGAVLVQQFEGGWGMTVAGVYHDDSFPAAADNDGFAGTVEVAGALGAASVTGAVAYAEDGSGFTSSDNSDDGWGGFVSASMPVGPVDLTGMVGGTTDGYMWDNGDFGPFEMIGDVNIINTGVNPSELGETWFVVLNPSYKASEKLTLGAVLAYVPTDFYEDGESDRDFMEVSGRVTYAVTDAAKLIGVLGYLDTDDLTSDDPIGAGLSLEVSF